MESGPVQRHYIQGGMRADPPPMTQGTSAKAVVGLWPPSMIRTRRAAFAQSGNRFRSGQTRSICREIIHKNISDSNSVRSDHDPLRASNPEIPQFIACLCRPQNGQPISSWSFCTLAALRQNAKKKTPASWRPSAVLADFSDGARGQTVHWRPDRRPSVSVALLHAIEPHAIAVSPCAANQ